MFWTSMLALAFVTLAPVELRPVTDFSPDIERFGAFLVVTALLVLGYPRHRVLGTCALVAAAGGLEILQNVVPGRHGRLGDFELKAAGVLAGAAATWFGEALVNGSEPRDEEPTPS